jgi:hypothetical protein
MFEAPANFIEQYFPTKLLRDLQAAGNGDRSGDLSHLEYEHGPSRRPAISSGLGTASTTALPTRAPRSPALGQILVRLAARSRSPATTTSTS